MQLKKFSLGSYELAMLVLVLCAVIIRLILISHNWPFTDSDEGTIDLMALHIAYRGEHPIFFYGQNYMGAFEAYLGAPLFRLFGPSVFIERLTLLPLYMIFLICMYFITATLYTKKLALFTTLLLSLGSSDILTHQLMAIGGYPEIMAFGALIFLLAFRLALSSPHLTAHTERPQRTQRILLYVLLGLFIGLSLWIDPLLLPCITLSVLLLLCFCGRELLRWEGLAGLLGCLLGAMPLIIYNLYAPPAQNSLATLLQLHDNREQDFAAQGIPLLQRLGNTVALSIPTITGANPCHWLVNFSPSDAAHASPGCTIFQSTWGIGVLVLCALALLLACSALWQLWQVAPPLLRTRLRNWPFAERQLLIRQCARLALLLNVVLTLALFATSSAAALFPLTSSRYLLCILLSTPALLWPLWPKPVESDGERLPWTGRTRDKSAPTFMLARIAVLLFIASTFLMGTVSAVGEIPGVEAANARQQTLANDLLRIGATRIYSEYWTCDRLIFQTHERIICAVLNDSLGQGFDRYKPYRYIVRATPHPAYVFPLGTPQAQTFARLHRGDRHYQRSILEGYVVYRYRG
jgi:hypothetical protein